MPDAPAKTTLPCVKAVDVPVPPFATLRTPANVTAPVVAVLGVKPVAPALKELTTLTPPAGWNVAKAPTPLLVST